MNKNLDIRKNTNVLFILNIVVLITMIFFRNYYGKLGYTNSIINVFLVINIILLVTGIVFNILFIKDAEKYDNKKTLIIILVIFTVYFLLNTVGVISINNVIRGGFKDISAKVSGYCTRYVCDKYETILEGKYEVFVINNKYFDYDDKENNLEIRTKYNKEKVTSVTATIYSRKEMYSEKLINDKIKGYFYNIDVKINESKITEAFNNRFKGSIKDNNITYEVKEVYNNKNELEKLKTIITLDLE